MSQSIVLSLQLPIAHLVYLQKRIKPAIVFKYLFSQYIFSLFDELFLILLSTMHGNIYTDTITFAHTKVGLSLNISTKEIFYHMGTEIQL